MAEGYDGRYVTGHVFWVRDDKGAWHPILTLRGVEGAKGETGDVAVPIMSLDGTLSWEKRAAFGELPAPVNLRGPSGEPGPRGYQGLPGPQGPQGARGDDGLSAYDIAKMGGYEGTAPEFMEALAQTTETKAKAEEAHDLAMKNNHAHVFQTQEERNDWMNDPQMRNLLNVGDFIIVKETNTRTYWDGNAEQSLDYSGTITAEQVTVGTWETSEARASGEDNYTPVYGFGLNLATLAPGALPEGAVARVRSISMRTSIGSGSFREAQTVYLVLTGTDGRVWTSDEPQVFEKADTVVTFTFALGADLPGGVAEARFVGAYTQAVTGVPLRVTRTGTQPDGNYIITSSAGAKRTQNGPALIPVTFSSVGTVAGELDRLEEQIGSMTTAYKYKGTVVTVEDLPTEGNTEGDVWNVETDGMNYAWTGEAWDALGPTIDLSSYYTKTEADGRYLKLKGGVLTGLLQANGGLWVGSPCDFGNNTVMRGVDFRRGLVAGDNVTLETQSDGKVKVSATGGGGEAKTLHFEEGGTDILFYGGTGGDCFFEQRDDNGGLFLNLQNARGDRLGFWISPDGSSKRIHGLTLPVESSDAASKAYVDEAVAEGGGSYTLPVATATTLGGVKVGRGLEADSDGTLRSPRVAFDSANGGLVISTPKSSDSDFISLSLYKDEKVFHTRGKMTLAGTWSEGYDIPTKQYVDDAVNAAGGGGGGGTYPIALDGFDDAGYLWLGAYDTSDFFERTSALVPAVGEPYVAVVKAPTAGGSDKPCGIFLGYNGEGVDANGYGLHIAIGGKMLNIPFEALCTWAKENLQATVTEH